MSSITEKLRGAVGSMAEKLLSSLPLRNTILFESSPDFACNTYPVFLQLRKELPEYKLIWYGSGDMETPEGVDDLLIHNSTLLSQRLKQKYHMYTAKAFIFSNREVGKVRPDQVHLFLCHGSKTKKTRGQYEVNEGVDYINVQSHFFDDIITYEYNCQKEKLVYLGYPRCDSFFRVSAESVKQKLHFGPEKRYFVWLPTYRKHKNTAVAGMEQGTYSRMGMPLVYDTESLSKLDTFLGERNMVIFFKPHPAQDISGLVNADTKNIRIVNDKDLNAMDVPLYDLLAGSDGLITDYSSVFFDYLLADKPIATTTDDAQEWKKMTGFAFDLDAFLDEATTRVPDLEGLLTFLDAQDDKAPGRKRIRELTNTYFDGDSAKRVAAFIREKIGA